MSGEDVQSGDDPLLTAAQFLRGVGPERAVMLQRLGLDTIQDVLFFLPRGVLDLSDVRGPAQLEDGVQQSVYGAVVETDGRQISGGRTMTAVLLRCGNDFVRGVWFNQPWMAKKFRPDAVVIFSGKPKRRQGRWEFSNPHVQWLDTDDIDTAEAVSVLPLYRLTDGLTMREIRRITRNAVEEYGHLLPERITEDWRRHWNVSEIQQAVRGIHMPDSMAAFDAGRRRMMFEDLLEFQLAIALRRRAWWRDNSAPKLLVSKLIDSRIRRLFPFQFTAGQNQAVADITRDFASGQAMHRLLQADVGAGKTAIAVYAMLVAVAAGCQAVLMAPTELLASQHWQTIDRTLANSRVERALLTGSLTAAQRRRTLDRIASGEVQLIVGTQSLIQQGVTFQNLGLAVIDEQHKFGVGQRARFSSGAHNPHVLVMTATPIPRSLCMTQFGDLDLTLVSDLPPGRQPVKTWLVGKLETRLRAWKFVRERVQEGRQVYIVCPRVGEAESDQMQFQFDDVLDKVVPSGPEELTGSTEELFRELSDGELKGFRIDMVHGRMDAQRKADVMDAFRAGEIQALVSTTVIEVGVDVPNATIMVIQQAERFGLSQLHQLRGRVGRGRHQGYCFLFSEADAPDVLKRLQAMEQYADGFQIAEVDFDLRGPGDILGTRQHGALPLRYASLLRDRDLVAETRRAALEMVDVGRFDDPDLVPLKAVVLERFGELLELPRSG